MFQNYSWNDKQFIKEHWTGLWIITIIWVIIEK